MRRLCTAPLLVAFAKGWPNSPRSSIPPPTLITPSIASLSHQTPYSLLDFVLPPETNATEGSGRPRWWTAISSSTGIPKTFFSPFLRRSESTARVHSSHRYDL